MGKFGLIRLGAGLALVLLYPFLSHRAQFWRYKMLGLAYTARNRGKFKHLGEGAFLSRDLILRGPEFISLGAGASVGRGCSLTAWDAAGVGTVALEIGENTSIGEGAHITAANRISIGNNVLFGKYITVSDNSHGAVALAEIETPPIRRPLVSKGPVVIEDNVWIGDKATILAGVTVGRGAIVAANAVVTRDVPPACMVAGAPAKLVKSLE